MAACLASVSINECGIFVGLAPAQASRGAVGQETVVDVAYTTGLAYDDLCSQLFAGVVVCLT